MLIKYYADYSFSTDDENQCNDIVTSKKSQITINNYLYLLHVIYVKQYISIKHNV